MKRKLSAIFFLLIFVFNLFGYRVVSAYMQHTIDTTMEAVIDQNNFNEQDLISIKASVTLPYYNNSNAFERIDGEIRLNGILYRYVKCRIYNDSLEMLCIPNKPKQQWQFATEQFGKYVNDIAQNLADKKSPYSNINFSLKKLLSEYEECNGWQLQKHFINTSGSYSFVSINNWQTFFRSAIEQPPERAGYFSLHA